MTPEQAREGAAVMVAYADGKEIQWHDHDDPPDDWSLCSQGDKLAFDWACFDYCIKPEPKLVPFDAKTVPRDAWVRGLDADEQSASRIMSVQSDGITIFGPKHQEPYKYTWRLAFDYLVFARTGKPFGRMDGGE